MAQPWSYSFAFGDGESDSEDEDATTTNAQQMQGVQFMEQPVEQELSEDTRLARELDLSTRKDTAVFRKTPWTVAKTNAASRPAIKPSVPSIPDPHALKSSNGSLITTENTKRPKQVLQKNLTDHFKKRGSNRKDTPGPTVERAKAKPAMQEIVVTKPASPKKKEPSPPVIRSLPQKQPQPPHRRPFISPLKNLLQPPPYAPNSPRPPKQPVTSKVEVFPGPAPPNSIAPDALPVALIASTTPVRSNVKETITPTVKRETVTPATKKAGDTFRASTPLAHTASFTPVKRKRESSPTELSAAHPRRPSSPALKRVRKEESPPPPPRKLVRSTARPVQGASVYGNGVFTSNDEQWSTLQTRKKPQSVGLKNPSSGRLITGGFRLPTSFLGVPKNVQGSVRPKRTLLTLYQPPPPLPPTRSREDMDKEMGSTSDPSEASGSGESDGSAIEVVAKFASPEDQEGNFRFSYPGVDPIIDKDDKNMPITQEEDEALGESDLIASMDSVALQARFPRLVGGLRERHRVLRVPLWELLGIDSCGVVWDDEWTEEGDVMRIPVLPLKCTDGDSDVPD